MLKKNQSGHDCNFSIKRTARSTRNVIDRIHFFVDKTITLKDHKNILLTFLTHNNNEQQVRGRANVCVFHQMFGGESSWRQGDYILPLHPALCTPVTQGNQFLGGTGPFSRLNETNFSSISFNFHLEAKMTLVYKESIT